ncbi:MAG: phosphate ABC transporter substrate-binding protein [Caloramator sp.]|nr:phosphate ABC transporter substrate-binding protein [Caloramator sp.]
MKKMKRFVAAVLAAMTLTVSVPYVKADAKSYSGNIKCSGSTALLPIIKQAADDFMKANPKVTIEVTGGGSGTGIKNVQDGVVDIGNSDVFAPEGSGLVDHQIAVIPFLFIVNPSVQVSNLTKQQLVDIFSGKITNWKEVGGNDQKITVIMRQASSGTRMTVQQLVMGSEQFTTNAIVQDSNGSVKATVAKTPGAIGYVDLAYVDKTVKALKYEGVECTIDNVKNGKYKLASIGHMYTKGQPSELVKAFIDYVQSSTFQNRVLPFYKFAPANSSAINQINKIKLTTSNSKSTNVKPSSALKKSTKRK